MLLDENSDKKISFADFEKMFKRYRFNLSQIEINNLFNFFDKDKSGFIDYSEFLKEITGTLSDFRIEILKKVFQKLDKNEQGFINVKIMRDNYDPKGHPLVRQNKRSEDEILGEFIDMLEYHFNLLNEKNEENEDVNDIKIDFEDFSKLMEDKVSFPFLYVSRQLQRLIDKPLLVFDSLIFSKLFVMPLYFFTYKIRYERRQQNRYIIECRR